MRTPRAFGQWAVPCTLQGGPRWQGSAVGEKRKDIEYHLTQNQLTELLETESARALIEAGEERGWIEPAELEAFAVENDLGEPDVEEVERELERIGLEVREPVVEEKNTKAQAGAGRSTRPTRRRARATACSSSSPTSASTSC